jgi:hypothetical protein
MTSAAVCGKRKKSYHGFHIQQRAGGSRSGYRDICHLLGVRFDDHSTIGKAEQTTVSEVRIRHSD